MSRVERVKSEEWRVHNSKYGRDGIDCRMKSSGSRVQNRECKIQSPNGERKSLSHSAEWRVQYGQFRIQMRVHNLE